MLNASAGVELEFDDRSFALVAVVVLGFEGNWGPIRAYSLSLNLFGMWGDSHIDCFLQMANQRTGHNIIFSCTALDARE